MPAVEDGCTALLGRPTVFWGLQEQTLGCCSATSTFHRAMRAAQSTQQELRKGEGEIKHQGVAEQ